MKTIYVVHARSYSLSPYPEDEWLVAAYEFAEQAEAHARYADLECGSYIRNECLEDGEWNDRAAAAWGSVSKYDVKDAVLSEGGIEYWVEEVELLQEVK